MSAPKPGDRAPELNLSAAGGSIVTLAEFTGKANVVLVFYRGYW